MFNHNGNLRLSGLLRLKLSLSALAISIFLIIYEKLVCPFLEQIGWLPGPFNDEKLKLMFASHPELMPHPRFTENFDFGSLVHTLLLLVVFLFLREIVFFIGRKVPESILPPRHAYRLSVISWLIMGFVVCFYFNAFYANYPVPSLFKLLAGYWFLGAALVAQYEYLLYERAYRKNNSHRADGPAEFLERLPKRISHITVLTASVPTVAIIAMMYRYAFEENFVPRGVSYEVAFLMGVLLLIGLWIANSYGRTLRSDMHSLVSVIRQIQIGQYKISVPVLRADELGEVGKGVLEMAKGLEERETIRDAFGHFVAPEVADEFIKYYASGTDDIRSSKRRKAVVMMCDLRSFTPLSESMSPEELTDLLNEYFTRMVRVIDKHQGLVDKFIGDAIMSLFGVVGDPQEAATKAVQAAVLMQQALDELGRERNLPQLKAGIGIHTGEMVMGYIGSEQRVEFTAIGEVVNLAARLEGAAKAPHPPVIFSKAIKDEIMVMKGLEPVRVGEVQLKGVTQAQEIFSLESLLLKNR